VAPRVRSIVRGDKEIIANIRRAKNAVGGAAQDKILRDGLEPMKEETIAGALERRQHGYNPPGGHLDQGVVVARRKARGRNFKEYWLTFRKRARKIAHLVEYGTAPHWQPRRGIMHPGARPYPFARPAFETTKDIVLQRIGHAIWRRIESTLMGTRRR
jgi:hypothetical protein